MKINAHEIVKTFPDYIVWGDNEDIESRMQGLAYFNEYVFPFHYVSDKDRPFLLRLMNESSSSLALPLGLCCDLAFYGRHRLRTVTAVIYPSDLMRNNDMDVFNNPYLKEAGLEFVHLFTLYALAHHVSADLEEDLVTIRNKIRIPRTKGFVSKSDIPEFVLNLVMGSNADLGDIFEFYRGVTFADFVDGDKDVAAEYLASALSAHVRVVELLAAQIQKLIDLHTRLEPK